MAASSAAVSAVLTSLVANLVSIAIVTGVALIMGLFFTVLGDDTSGRSYQRALQVALSCNAGLMLLTALLALLLPRRRPGMRTPLWQQRKRSADARSGFHLQRGKLGIVAPAFRRPRLRRRSLNRE